MKKFENLMSECCGASPWLGNTDHGRCGDCKECCDFLNEDELWKIN